MLCIHRPLQSSRSMPKTERRAIKQSSEVTIAVQQHKG